MGKVVGINCLTKHLTYLQVQIKKTSKNTQKFKLFGYESTKMSSENILPVIQSGCNFEEVLVIARMMFWNDQMKGWTRFWQHEKLKKVTKNAAAQGYRAPEHREPPRSVQVHQTRARVSGRAAARRVQYGNPLTF